LRCCSAISHAIKSSEFGVIDYALTPVHVASCGNCVVTDLQNRQFTI
jgi:hypothetical protein